MQKKKFPPFHAASVHRRFTLKLSLLVAAALFAAFVCFVQYSPHADAQQKRLQMDADLQKVFSAHEELRLDPATAQRDAKADGRLSLTTLGHHFDLQLQTNDLR